MFLSLLQEENSISTNNKISLDEYSLEESYYNTLLESNENNINHLKNLIEYKEFVLNEDKGLITFLNDLTLKDVFKWFKGINNDLRSWYFKNNEDINFQMNIIKKYTYMEGVGKQPITIPDDLYLDFLKLPFSEKDIEDKFMNNMDLRKKRIWLNKRDIYDDIFIRSFPKWIIYTRSTNKMKEYILDNSSVYISKGNYNIQTLYPKVDKYIKILKKEYNFIKDKFFECKDSMRSLNDELKSILKDIESRDDVDKQYIEEIKKVYSNNYQKLFYGMLTYQRSMYYIIIDMVNKLKTTVNRMYKAIPLADRYKSSKVDIPMTDYYKQLKKELMMSV